MMKKASLILFLLVSIGLSLISCRTEKPDSPDEIEEEWPVDSRLTDCDAFLDSYEEWIGEYLERLKKKLNARKRFSKDEIIESPKKITKWAERWYAMSACADHPKYQRRFEKISDDFKKSLKGLEIIRQKEKKQKKAESKDPTLPTKIKS